MKVKTLVGETSTLVPDKLNKTDKPLSPDLLRKMNAYWWRRQLSVGRPDLSLRQSVAAGAAEAVAREAAGGRALGHDAGPELHLCAFEPGHQEV